MAMPVAHGQRSHGQAASSPITYRLTSDCKQYWNLGGIQLTKAGAHVPVDSRWVAASSTQPGYDAADLFQDWTFKTPSKMAWSPDYRAEGPPYWIQWEAGDADTIKIRQSAHQHQEATLTRSDRAGNIQLALNKVLNKWISFPIEAEQNSESRSPQTRVLNNGSGTKSAPHLGVVQAQFEQLNKTYVKMVNDTLQGVRGFGAVVDIDGYCPQAAIKPSATISSAELHEGKRCVHSLIQTDSDSGECSGCKRWIFVGEKVMECAFCNDSFCASCHPQEQAQGSMWQGFLNTIGVGLRDGQALGAKIEKEIQMEIESFRSIFQQCQPTRPPQEPFEQVVASPCHLLAHKRTQPRALPQRNQRFFAMIDELGPDDSEGLAFEEVDQGSAGPSCTASQSAIDVDRWCSKKLAIDIQPGVDDALRAPPAKMKNQAPCLTSGDSSKDLAEKYATCSQPAAHTKGSKMDHYIPKAADSAPCPTSEQPLRTLAEMHADCPQPASGTEASKMTDFKSEPVGSSPCSTSECSSNVLTERHESCLQPAAQTKASTHRVLVADCISKSQGFGSDFAKRQGESFAPLQTRRGRSGCVDHSQLTTFRVAVAPVVAAASAKNNSLGSCTPDYVVTEASAKYGSMFPSGLPIATKNQTRKPQEASASDNGDHGDRTLSPDTSPGIMTESQPMVKASQGQIRKVAAATRSAANSGDVEDRDAGAIRQEAIAHAHMSGCLVVAAMEETSRIAANSGDVEEADAGAIRQEAEGQNDDHVLVIPKSTEKDTLDWSLSTVRASSAGEAITELATEDGDTTSEQTASCSNFELAAGRPRSTSSGHAYVQTAADLACSDNVSDLVTNCPFALVTVPPKGSRASTPIARSMDEVVAAQKKRESTPVARKVVEREWTPVANEVEGARCVTVDAASPQAAFEEEAELWKGLQPGVPGRSPKGFWRHFRLGNL